MIRDLQIAHPSHSGPYGPTQRWVAQLRCTLSPSFLLRTRFLPDSQSEATPPSPSPDPVSRSSDHFQSASHPRPQSSAPSTQH